MQRVVVLFASMSGNTEEIAEIIETHLLELKVSVSLFQIDMDDVEVEDLLNYDAILLGSYTWGDGDVPYELEDFYEDLAVVDLSGKAAACFGSCDSMYPAYGGAVDKFEEQLAACGAKILIPSLKVELTPEEDDVKRCQKFVEDFTKNLHASLAKN
ncbi:flavodoxin [Halobacillus shinanisalinarum]|uniref:Flavodoxin n=1 Tax=Halobacillus shinanisalinarum TaxID=2932258 RepID=A0ABY4GYL9_9BACI|nr:flavodoxin [Halobacillus shinanisalinarum]UOQ93297.1 flavodoxin [Halobacillus shinanisalinarum]